MRKKMERSPCLVSSPSSGVLSRIMCVDVFRLRLSVGTAFCVSVYVPLYIWSP